MAVDAEGNDLSAVSVPLTGFAAVQLTGDPTLIESVAGAATPLVLPTGYAKVGLFKVDGGSQDAADTEDAIEFFQKGYKLAGDETLTVAINLAEFNETVRRLTTGKTPDANGMIVVDKATPDNTFPLFTYTKYKNGYSVRRNGMARVSAVERDQETRGEVNGRATTFEWLYDDTIGGYYREWVVPPTTPTPDPEQGS
jgi:hypothetical protein